MPITISDTTITGLGVGGLPAGTVNATTLANSAVTAAKIGYSGAVLQVATATKTSKQMLSGNANSFNEYDSGFRVTITPTNSSTKMLCFLSISGGSTTGCPRFQIQYTNNGGSSWNAVTPVGDADGSRARSHCSISLNNDGNVMSGTSAEVLFTHGTSSTMIFRVLMGGDVSGNWLMWNGSINNPNNFLGNTMTSTLRIMEIS